MDHEVSEFNVSGINLKKNDGSAIRRVRTRSSLWEHQQSHTCSEILLRYYRKLRLSHSALKF
ncbi:LOW QUALITY PROTEIN: hypothetical protein V1478_002229 [Vespula squamosa]|uniref:Uncharacterized protein n=1 Tax=Vespula squamosa TaxID=30214 RepID=A0ABD2BW38_VESSQ